MNALKEAKRLIATNPFSEDAQTLTDLVIALESAQPYKLERLYMLDMRTFEVAVEIIREWRLDRYYSKKGKLLDLSIDVQSFGKGGTGGDAGSPAA